MTAAGSGLRGVSAMAAWIFALWACIVLGPAVAAASEGEDPPPQDVDAAIASIRGALSVENTLLTEDRQAHVEVAQRRRSAMARLAELQSARDGAIAREDAGVPALLERLNVQIDQAEGERAELGASERMLVETVRNRLRRIALLDAQLADLLAAERPPQGLLSGRWDVALLPGAQRGTFDLQQTGTVVTGVYRLAGGFSGSLRGTLVRSKVFLERIDSQLGKSMAFEAHVSADGNILRGTWRNYELADGETASSGQWSGRRRTAE